MKTPAHRAMGHRLEIAMVAYFIFVALSLLVVYLADPAIYAHSLSLTSSSADRYPVPVTLFVVGVFAVIALLIFGVVRHWRWVFWLMLLAFASSALHIPVTLLQITGVLPTADPLWYGLFQMGVVAVELALALWMIHIYRRAGVWALGRNSKEKQ
jgi:hypothetical protein